MANFCSTCLSEVEQKISNAPFAFAESQASQVLRRRIEVAYRLQNGRVYLVCLLSRQAKESTVKPTNSKKLMVEKEILKTLTPDQLGDVVGGADLPPEIQH